MKKTFLATLAVFALSAPVSAANFGHVNEISLQRATTFAGGSGGSEGGETSGVSLKTLSIPSVPVPAAGLLLLAGLGGLAVLRRAKKA